MGIRYRHATRLRSRYDDERASNSLLAVASKQYPAPILQSKSGESDAALPSTIPLSLILIMPEFSVSSSVMSFAAALGLTFR